MGHRDPALLRQAETILARLKALRRELLHNPMADAERSGLTGPQVTVMASLVSQGPRTVTELSHQMGLTHSTTSGIVDRLQARGLVRRARDDTDRRRTRITVTDKVTRYVRQLEAGPSGRLAAVLERARPAQRRAIDKGLRLLSELLQIPATARS